MSKKENNEGRITKILDGIADITVQGVKTAYEISVAPLRIVGRSADGLLKGIKNGVGGAAKSTIDGVVDGVNVSAEHIGDGFKGIGDGYNKIAEGLSPKRQITDKEKEEYVVVEDAEIVNEK